MRHTRKKFYTDAANDAFHFYFMNPNYIEELLSKRRYDRTDRHRNGASDPTASAVIRRESIFEQNAANIKKWQAAQSTINRLKSEPHGEFKLRVLKSAYGDPSFRDVRLRVQREASRLPVSEVCAWKWLNNACRYWAEYRGLIDKSL